VGALRVGDSLDDGTLAGIERAGGWVEQRAREGTHLGYTVFVRKLDISFGRYTVCVSTVGVWRLSGYLRRDLRRPVQGW
jgi:hypothetical protein